MSKIFIGIDPGKEGGIVCLPVTGEAILTNQMPVFSQEVDGYAVAGTLSGIKDSGFDVIIGLEKVASMPGQGVKSMFSFGFGCGIVEGVIQTLQMPYVKIQPKAWQKVAFEGVAPIYKPAKPTKDGKPANPKIDTKAMALVAARRLYPNVNLLATEGSKVPHSGIVDALLIAHYLKVTNR